MGTVIRGKMKPIQSKKRIASLILMCGRRKVWIDPEKDPDISLKNSRKSMRMFITRGLIGKQQKMISPALNQTKNMSRIKVKRRGYGKRRGSKQSRLSSKTLWVHTLRALRRLLRKYRDAGKIARHLHLIFYAKCKGRAKAFQNRKKLIDAYKKEKLEAARHKAVSAHVSICRAKFLSTHSK